MRKAKRDIVSALIFSKDEKLFMGKKNPKEGGVYLHDWHLPGGGINKDENHTKALKREVLEETGIDISKYKTKLVDNQSKGLCEKKLKNSDELIQCEMSFNVYKIQINDKDADEIEVKLGNELSQHKWFEKSELKKVKLTPPSIELFKKLKLT